MSPIPVAANLFITEPELRLIGGRHRESGRVIFPLPGNATYEPVELPHRGLLWSFTIQRFAPKSPPYRGCTPFIPFALGYVELPGALIVESRLTHILFEQLRIGMPMQLTTVDLPVDGTDTVMQCYAFRPAAQTGAGQVSAKSTRIGGPP